MLVLAISIFSVSVKCIKNTPAYFAERLYKAMKVRLGLVWIIIFSTQLNKCRIIRFISPLMCVFV